MSAQWRLVRQLPLLREHRPRQLRIPRADLAPLPTLCECDEPDEQPVGGWFPPDITACARCGRPL